MSRPAAEKGNEYKEPTVVFVKQKKKNKPMHLSYDLCGLLLNNARIFVNIYCVVSIHILLPKSSYKNTSSEYSKRFTKYNSKEYINILLDEKLSFWCVLSSELKNLQRVYQIPVNNANTKL